MRDNSQGLIAKIIVGLIIVVFALFGMGSITTFLAPVPKVATVNGTDISQQEMEQAVERNRRIMRAQGVSVDDIDEDDLRKNVLRDLINRALLIDAADELGLGFSDAALDDEIRATPAFQLDGIFDPGQFQLVIGGAGFSPLLYRQEMRRDKTFQQLSAAISATAFYTEDEVLNSSSLAQQTRDIAYLRIDTDKLIDQIDVSDSEVELYYNANTNLFMTEESVDLSYVELKRSDLLDEVEVSEDALLVFYEDTKEIYAADERRQVAHILVEINDEVSQEEALENIQEVYGKLKSGADFADLAKQYSQDSGSAEEGGDLGFNAAGTFVTEFEEAAYDLALNQSSEPVLTEFGYHLIKLLGLEEATTPSFAEVREQLEKSYREAEAEEIFVTRSARLSEMAYESPDLIEPAEELGLIIQRTGKVNRDTTEGIAVNSNVLNAAFTSDVLLDRLNSELIAIDPNHHVVIRVEEYQPQEAQPLVEVIVDIRNLLVSEKSTQLAIDQSKEIVELLETGSITRFVADKFGLEWEVVGKAVRNQLGLDREIVSEAFSLPRPAEGTKSIGSSMLLDGDAVVLSVTNVTNSSESSMVSTELTSLSRVLAVQQGTHDYFEFRETLATDGNVDRVN
ncbi:MAG: peptidyl-prolyl cis-trans isomerase D [Candidatus Azotimanducaceae bacterium]|jgi:peptidyl-prolyl cis-trans isomerase D